MKSRIKVLTLVLLCMVILTACQSKQEAIFVLPTIPAGYVPDKSLYLADGDGVYAFVDNQAFDYESIGAEICNGNAQAVKLQFEERGNSKENPEEYAAIQNILGITEIYLGDYRQAYERFNETINFLDKKETPEKDRILTVLYNNSGAVTVYLSQFATKDKRLIKAAELCKEPYMALAIAVNQMGRVKADAPITEYGETVVRAKKLIEKERQIDDSPNFVLFTAARYMSVGYVFTVQEEKAVETLDENQKLVKKSGATVAGGYGDTVKEVLYELYCDENDSTVSFPDWLKKELEQYKEEEDRYEKAPE